MVGGFLVLKCHVTPCCEVGTQTRRLELVTHFLMWCQKTVVSTDVLHPCGQNLWWCGTHQQSGGGRDVSQCSRRPVVSSECPGSQLKAEYTVFRLAAASSGQGGGRPPTRCRPPDTWVWRTSTVKQKVRRGKGHKNHRGSNLQISTWFGSVWTFCLQTPAHESCSVNGSVIWWL